MSNETGRQIKLPTFAKGSMLQGQDLRDLADAVRAILTGSGNDFQNIPNPIAPITQQYNITSIADEYLVCSAWDGTNLGTQDVKIAKPFLLRKSTWDGYTDSNGVTYTVTGTQTLTAMDTSGNVENWKITFDYQVDDLITAVANVRGGYDSDSDDIRWIDLNTDARAWAKVSS